jgi:hypothetical protein
MEVLNADIQFGTQKEVDILSKLSTYFGENIQRATDKFSPYDGFSETAKYEIKSRRTRYNQYPTTIIGVNKLKTEFEKLIFCFNFTDGLYYIEYDENKFKNYTITDIKAIRGYGRETSTPHFHIPIRDLKIIN